MLQRSLFAESEADRWFERNRVAPADLERRAAQDPLARALDEHLAATGGAARALEIGAANGWRLAWLARRHAGLAGVALEPSPAALADARTSFPELGLARATAERLPFAPRSFDLVVLGFCLYLCDRDDLFRIAGEVDRVVREGGVVALYDFRAARPCGNDYVHAPGVRSYKMDAPSMFTWNPLYRVLRREAATHPGSEPGDPDGRTEVALLRRLASDAWPQGSAAPLAPVEAAAR